MSVASVSADPIATCPRCEGTGWRFVGGTPEPCRCRLDAERLAHIARAEGSIAARFRACSRSTWRGDWPLDAAANEWAASAGSDPWAVLLLGQPGIGKTHVATALYRELVARLAPPHALWITAEDASEAARREIGQDTGRRVLQRLLESDLLLLDDVGRERATEFSLELVRRVLHYRHREQLPTIVTANALALEDFDVFDPALTSRLREGTLVYALEGEDQRGKAR